FYERQKNAAKGTPPAEVDVRSRVDLEPRAVRRDDEARRHCGGRERSVRDPLNGTLEQANGEAHVLGGREQRRCLTQAGSRGVRAGPHQIEVASVNLRGGDERGRLHVREERVGEIELASGLEGAAGSGLQRAEARAKEPFVVSHAKRGNSLERRA